MLVILMLAASIWIFDLLRYITCAHWEPLPSAPTKVIELIGTSRERLYVKSLDQEIYCYEAKTWRTCKLLSEITWSNNVSGKAQPFFWITEEAGELVSLTRQGDFSENHYFALMKNGDLWVCSEDIETELSQILFSGAFLWLVIPIAISIFGFIAFLKIFAADGQIVFWDFFGRGKRL